MKKPFVFIAVAVVLIAVGYFVYQYYKSKKTEKLGVQISGVK